MYRNILKKGVNSMGPVHGNRTRGNSHKLKHKKLHVNVRKNFLTVRVTEHCNRLPREVIRHP